MTTATTETATEAEPSVLTARDVLGQDPDALRAGLEDVLESEEVRSALPPGTTGPAAGFVVAQAATALDQLLGELDLGTILMSAWNKLDELQAVIDETRADGSVRNLTVASHTVTSEHHPTLELVVNQAPKKFLDLVIVLGLTLDACDLVVDAGDVTGAQVGSLRAHGEVAAHGRTLISKESVDLDPKQLFPGAQGAGAGR